MRRIISALVLSVLILTARESFPGIGNPVEDYRAACNAGDYASAASMLEKMISDNNPQTFRGDRMQFPLALAELYAWRLGRPADALKILEQEQADAPVFMRLVSAIAAADISENFGEKDKAILKYQSAISLAKEILEKEHDTELVLAGAELADLCRYRIDGIRLKMKKQKDAPMLRNLKITESLMAGPIVYSMSSFPNYICLKDMKTSEGSFRPDVSAYILNSTASISSAAINHTILTQQLDHESSAEVDKALSAYLNKYGGDFFSLGLRYYYYRYFLSKGQEGRAQEMLAGLDGIALKRGMDFGLKPKPEFATPEKTWQTMIGFMSAGDAERAAGCFSPETRANYGRVFHNLGPTLRKIPSDFTPIQKIESDENKAKYRMRVKETDSGKESEITYHIYFGKYGSDWLILYY